jgi:hypothetical protein
MKNCASACCGETGGGVSFADQRETSKSTINSSAVTLGKIGKIISLRFAAVAIPHCIVVEREYP